MPAAPVPESVSEKDSFYQNHQSTTDLCIYANDEVIKSLQGGNASPKFGSGDDRSSGYRSSSSPSINSEENLYENGAMLMDDFSSQGSQGSQV